MFATTEDAQGHCAPEASPLGRSAWYHAQPEELRRRIDVAWRLLVLDESRLRAAMIRDGLLAVAGGRASTAIELGDLLAAAQAEHRRATAIEDLVAALVWAEAWRPRRSRLHARLAHWWPDLALVVAALVPDPLLVLRRLDPLGVRSHPGLRALADDTFLDRRATLGVILARVRALPAARRGALDVAVPFAAAASLRRLAAIPATFRRVHGIPPEVAERAVRASPYVADAMRSALANARLLCEEVRIPNAPARPLWRLVGLLAC